MRALARFVGLGLGSGRIGLGLVLGHLALGPGLVLLGFAFLAEAVVVGHVAGDLLGLALQILDDALGSGLSSVLRHHVAPHGGWVSRERAAVTLSARPTRQASARDRLGQVSPHGVPPGDRAPAAPRFGFQQFELWFIRP